MASTATAQPAAKSLTAAEKSLKGAADLPAVSAIPSAPLALLGDGR